jgi:hypothetical protein
LFETPCEPQARTDVHLADETTDIRNKTILFVTDETGPCFPNFTCRSPSVDDVESTELSVVAMPIIFKFHTTFAPSHEASS